MITASKIWFNEETMYIALSDERIVGVPLLSYPKLQKATLEQRNKFELWQQGKWRH